MDQQVTIQIYTKSRGTSGEEVKTWADWKTVWASVQITGGNEQFYSPQLVAEATHKILMRYIKLVGPDLRLVWLGKTLEITYIDESRYREGELYLLCKEVVT